MVFSTRPPESVCGTVGRPSIRTAAFLGSLGSIAPARRPWHSVSASGPTQPRVLFQRDSPTHVHPEPTPGRCTLLRPRSAPICRCRNINLLPIDYAVRLRLRGRLTLPGLSLDRKPWASGDKGFHLVYRYSCQHSHFLPLRPPSPEDFTAAGTLPYQTQSLRRAL